MTEILTARIICDNCTTEIYVASPADWLNYYSTWFEGILDEYCPACRALTEIAAQIEEELRLTTSFRHEPSDVENEFPEFIS